MLRNLNILVYTVSINYSGNLFIHSDTNHTFQKYDFELPVYSNISNMLLSFTLLNNELAVMEILFESKLR